MFSLRLETRRVLSGTLLSESGNITCKPVCYRWHFGKRKLWDYLSCLGYCAGQAGGGKRICTLGICKKRSQNFFPFFSLFSSIESTTNTHHSFYSCGIQIYPSKKTIPQKIIFSTIWSYIFYITVWDFFIILPKALCTLL